MKLSFEKGHCNLYLMYLTYFFFFFHWQAGIFFLACWAAPIPIELLDLQPQRLGRCINCYVQEHSLDLLAWWNGKTCITMKENLKKQLLSRRITMPYTATLLIWPPRYNSHFILALKISWPSFCHLKSSFCTTTLSIQPDFVGPLLKN